jgi:hypothetical protein
MGKWYGEGLENPSRKLFNTLEMRAGAESRAILGRSCDFSRTQALSLLLRNSASSESLIKPQKENYT